MVKEDELSLIDVINTLKEFVTVLKKNLLFIGAIALLTSSIGILRYYNSKPSYTAVTTMMLENSKGGEMSGAMAIASQFGLMSGGGSSEINEEKLVAIISSKTIVKNAILKKGLINLKNDLLGNHFLDLFGYTEKWQKKDPDSLKGFRFQNEENLNLLEGRVFNILYAQLIESALSVDKGKNGIITVKVKTGSEEFSQIFNKALIVTLTDFYVNRITEKGRTNLNVIQKRVDSVSIALKNSEIALAKWKDGNFQLVKAQGMMEEMDLRRDVEVNNSIYIEGIKQLEISKFNLLQDTPFLHIIDSPTLPIKGDSLSLLKNMVAGFLLGFIFSSIYVFVRKKLKDVLAEEEGNTQKTLN